jgi:hypothetical protein
MVPSVTCFSISSGFKLRNGKGRRQFIRILKVLAIRIKNCFWDFHSANFATYCHVSGDQSALGAR